MLPGDNHHRLERCQPQAIEKLVNQEDHHFPCRAKLRQNVVHLNQDSKEHNHQTHLLRYQFYCRLELLFFRSFEVNPLTIDLHRVRQLEHQQQT